MKLGRLGVWNPNDRLTPPDLARLLHTAEDLGYTALWYPEAVGYEALSSAAFMLGNSKNLTIGSSIASTYARDPFTARQGMLGLNRMYDDRFILGLGVSHANMVQARGHDYDRPLPTMRAYLDRLQADDPAAADWPVMLAALGPLMLKLAFARTQGALPVNTTPEHTRLAAAAMPPGKHLAVAQKFLFTTDPARARAIGRAELAMHLALPNYIAHFQRMGFSPAELENGGSDSLVDALITWGPPEDVKRRIRAHFDAGATHVCIRPLHEPGDFATRDAMLATMADL
jgi:probable F420-dependent oxidoreductase